MSLGDCQLHYDEIISLCYECVLDESQWQVLVEAITRMSGRQDGALMMLSKQTETVQISEIKTYDAELATAYNQYYHQFDPGYRFMPQRAVGRWYHDFEDYGRGNIACSAYYQEFHRSCGLGNVSSVKLYEGETSSAFLSLLTGWNKQISEPKSQELLQRLATHLGVAGRLASRIHGLELDLAKRDLLSSQYACPLWLLDEQRRVVYCNHVADRLMAQKDAALFQSFGRLQSHRQNAQLQRLIYQAIGKEQPRRAGWMQLDEGAGVSLLITPVPAAAAFNGYFQKPLVMLALLGRQVSPQLLTDLFQLSPAESRLALLLARGISSEECAEVLGISINTVRTQLRALYRKTCTERQSELVSLLGGLGR